MPPPAPGCPCGQGGALLQSRGERGFLLRVPEQPTGAERNWPELQPSIHAAPGSGDSTSSSLPGCACSAATIPPGRNLSEPTLPLSWGGDSFPPCLFYFGFLGMPTRKSWKMGKFPPQQLGQAMRNIHSGLFPMEQSHMFKISSNPRLVPAQLKSTRAHPASQARPMEGQRAGKAQSPQQHPQGGYSQQPGH